MQTWSAETPAEREVRDRQAIQRAVTARLEDASRTWETTREERLSDQIGPMVARVRSDPANTRR